MSTPVSAVSPSGVPGPASDGALLGRARRHLAEPLNRTSFSLMTSTLLTAVAGLGFWALAARLYPPTTVGRDSALISAMTAIAGITQLNLGNVIVRFLPQVRVRLGSRIVQAYALAAALSLLVGAGFVVVGPLMTRQFSFLRDGWLLTGTFAFAVAASAIFALQDAVLTALGRAPWLPIENGLFGAVKLAALPIVMLLGQGHGVFLAWVVPMFATIPVVNLLIARRALPAAARAQRSAPGNVSEHGRRPLISFVVQDAAGAASSQLAMIALPLVVLGTVGATGAAYFYVPLMLVMTFDLMFQAVAISLMAEAARRPDRIAELTRAAVRRLLRWQLPASAAIVLGAPWILMPFGAAYVHHSTVLLRLFGLASCFRAMHFLYAAAMRLQRRGTRLLSVQLANAILLIGLCSWLGARWGMVGLGLGWLLAPASLCVLIGHDFVSFVRHPRLHKKPPPAAAAGVRP